MLPPLEITAEMVGPNRTGLTLAYLESEMLWTHDEEMRREGLKTSTADFVQWSIKFSAGQTVEPVQWLHASELLADAYPVRHMAEQARTPFKHGVFAGELLAAAVVDHYSNGAVKLTALKAQMLDPKRRKKH